jgi:GntR family transcriptional regulator, arabinose operon transcriptional repressor
VLLKPTPKIDLTDATPRYYQMYLSLRDRIKTGEFLLNGMLPNERELGEEYSVSRITVIKALDILESEGLIDRQQGRGTFVRANANKVPKNINMAQTVAFVCGFISHPFEASILVGIAGVLAKHGISLQVFGSVDNSEAEVQSIEKALDREVNGIIVYPWSDYQNAPFFQKLLERGVPLVMVDRYYPELHVDYAVFDGWQGGFELTNRLIQQGHNKIAFAISDEVLPSSVHDRLSGYKAALEKHGLPYDENLVWVNVTVPTQPLRERKTQNVLEKEFYEHLFTERPTGLVAVNYDVAEFLQYNIYLRSIEPGIPADYMKTIEISSFCHHPKPIFTPYISTLAMQPGEPLGVAAAEILVDKFVLNAQATSHQIKLPMEIVETKTLRTKMESNTLFLSLGVQP